MSILLSAFKRLPIRNMFIAVFTCTAAFLVMQDFSVGTMIHPLLDTCNIFLLLALCGIIFAVTTSLRAGLIVVCVFCCLVSLLNQYLIRFRGQILKPWDFSAVRTAVSVMRNYDLTPTKDMAATVVFLLLLIIGIVSEYRKGKKPDLRARILCAVGSFAVFLCIVGVTICTSLLPVYVASFNHTLGASWNGTFLYFIMQCGQMQDTVPEGYDEEEIKTLLASFKEEESEDSGKHPNIIAIMGEAFSDPAVLGNIPCNEDYIPFFHAITKEDANTVSGYIHVSSVGGGTANTEYEFLSGNSMAFFTDGIYPYEQIINSESDTSYMLPAALRTLGYRTIAMHPYLATGYNRNRVYAYMGFDEFITMEDFTEPYYIRDFISDRTLFQRIISEYEETDADTPFFCFAVTIQNHGFYSDQAEIKQQMEAEGTVYKGSFDYDGDIYVEREDDKELETYLSLEKLTDDSLKELVEYFATQEDDTVIVFFGDHQPSPSVTAPIVETEDIFSYYKVPFVIYANFPIQGEHKVETSANYLQTYLRDICGLPDHAYTRFLRKTRDDVPVLSTPQTIVTRDSESEKWYEMVQYYLAHKKK
ncbi:MAG: LTA synthase family protein [Clostridiales bacterium]|nr:LTA synthase family protein [Clostridiales bacterium]